MKSLYLGIAFTVSVIAVGLYIASGSLAEDTPSATPANHPVVGEQKPTTTREGLAPVSSLVTGLENRLQEQPDDGKGWLLLAKSYQHLGRLDDAREAYRKADALGHADATVAAQLFGLSVAEQ